MEKSRDAFRTISEVAEVLDTPAHVLRFWESRFPQVRPVKRAGGRRYYRPTDVVLLSGIKQLLHNDGLTIRGVQKVLREQGIRHVMAMAEGGVLTDGQAETETQVAPGGGGEPGVLAMPAAEDGQADVLLPATPLTRPAPVAPGEPLPLWTAVAAAAASEADAAPPPPQDDGSDTGADGIPAFLRRLSAERVAENRADLAAIAARLMALRSRLAAASGQSAG